MSSDSSYLRCRHCKGFYETSFARCKWCNYDTPVLKPDGSPRIFPNREICRAIQIAEFEQLLPEAHEDCFRPPPEHPEIRCECIHCGEAGYVFEAIEMRWMPNEKMWACPCTTCGGRGFSFDIHPVERRWQCSECNHFFDPPDGQYTSENAICPKCGSRVINGWFDCDEDEEGEEFDDDDLYDDELDDAAEDWQGGEMGLASGWKAEEFASSDEEQDLGSPGHWIEDDIDHPRPGRSKTGDSDFDQDDIPF